MSLPGSVLKWTGIAIGLAVLSIAGFVLAAFLSPGDPGRSYLIAMLVILSATILWRLFASRKWQ